MSDIWTASRQDAGDVCHPYVSYGVSMENCWHSASWREENISGKENKSSATNEKLRATAGPNACQQSHTKTKYCDNMFIFIVNVIKLLCYMLWTF